MSDQVNAIAQWVSNADNSPIHVWVQPNSIMACLPASNCIAASFIHVIGEEE